MEAGIAAIAVAIFVTLFINYIVKQSKKDRTRPTH